MNRSDKMRVRAARAAKNFPSRPNSGTHVPLTSPTPVHATGLVRRSRATSLTATQRNSEGRRSEWSASPEFFTDPKWSATCSTV